MKKPYLETSTEWLTQSSLLLQAYPTTTRITTKYSIKPPPTAEALSKKRKRGAKTSGDGAEQMDKQSPEDAVKNMTPRAYITLKTFEPDSGICLKYRTDKEREVGRLIASLGRLGREMAALPDAGPLEGTGEVEKADGVVEDGAAAEKVAQASTVAPPPATGGGTGGGTGGAKKKKKGKK